jgi:hypothetical protein
MATKTTEKGTSIELPELRMEMLDIRIRGLTPLLQNRFSEEKARAITDDQAHGAKGPRAARQPEVEFEQARHRTEDGRDAVNALAVKKAIVSAGQRFADEKGTILRGAFTILADLLPIEGPEPTMQADRVVHGGMSKVTSIAYRPRYWPWEIVVPVMYNRDVISRDQLVNLVRLAGASVGLGAWRVENKGNCGSFSVVAVQVVEQA